MKQLKKPTFWIPAVALLVYILTIFLFPAFVRDNGENFRFLTENNLYRLGDLWYGFDADFAALTAMPFSAIKLLYQAVIGIWHGLFGLATIDIRLFSMVYVALTLFALWMIARNLNLRTTLANTIAGILVVLLATSYGLFSYFNTFYHEGAVLPLLLLASAGLMQFTQTRGIRSFLLFVFAAACFVTLGPIPALLVVFFAAAGIRLAFLPTNWWKRVLLLVLSLLLMPLSYLGFSSLSVAEYQENLYNAVFYGALGESVDSKEVLSEMGLSEDLAVYTHKPYFEIEDKTALSELFYPNFRYGKLATYYLKHPKAFFAVLRQAGNNVYETSISYLRSYEEDVVSVQRILSAPTRWYESLKLRFLPRGVTSWLVYLILFVILACVRRKTLEDDGEKARTDCTIIFACMPMLFLLATPFTSGLTEISKRLFYTNAVFECFLVLLISYAVELIILRRNRLRDQYGVNQ